MLKALLVDDHAIFREGLKLLLSRRADISVAGEASSGPEAVRLAAELRPDLVILDLAMPEGNGMDAVPRILEACPGARIICLSTLFDRQIVVELLERGIHGYALKSGSFAELGSAIDQVLSGHRYLSPEIADGIMEAFLSPAGKAELGSEGAFGLLSERERAVLRLICEDKSPKEIAGELGISRKTVDVHKRNLMQKLGVGTDLALIKLAIKARILPDDHTRLPDP